MKLVLKESATFDYHGVWTSSLILSSSLIPPHTHDIK